MRLKIILSFLTLLSLAFLVPSDAFGEITTATVTDGDSRFIVGGYPAITTSETTPRHVEFNTDGTKMFIVGGTLDFVYEWTLTTGFDISTATYDGGAEAFDLHKNNNAAKGDGQPRGIHFNPEGTKMFVVGNAADEINQYTLSTGFDVSTTSTANPVRKDITATVGGSPQGLEFNTDGTKMFVVHRSGTNSLHEFTLTTGFDISTMINDGSDVKSTIIDDLNGAFGIAFSSDGTKMFVVENSNASDGTDQTVNEYTLSAGFDITTASFTYSFDYSNEAVDIHGVEFSDDGKKMFLMDTKLNSRDGTGYLYEYILSCPWQLTGTCGNVNSHYCWDCEAPKLTKAEVLITSQNSETQHISQSSDIWNFDHNYPLFAIDDYKTPIIADPGDKVEIILELTDNRSLKGISDSGTYTNFMNLPKDMNLFYANNFDKFGKVSTTFYEWHQTGDDLVYDYSKSTEWTEPSIVIEEISTYQKDIPGVNLDGIVGTFTITYKIKFLEPMQTTEVWVYAADEYGNFFKLPLPFTLKIAGNEPLVFESNVNQKVLGFYDESMLNDVVSDWTGSSQDVSDLAKILGIPDEQIPPWVTNLAVWVSEDKISMGDMIVSIEHLINN